MMGPSEKLKAVIPPSAVSVDSQLEPKSPPDTQPLTGGVDPCELALADFNQAIALNPNYGIFYYMRGVLLATDSCSLWNLERAVADYDQAIRLSPSNAAYYQERGNARVKLKQYGQAINDIDRAILIEPMNYYFYYEKGLVQEKMGRSEDAADSIKRALELAPADQLELFIAALERVRNGISRALIADYTFLIAKRPTVSSFYVQRGLLYGDKKRFTSAVDDLSTALSFQKDNGDLYFTRGKLFYEAGKKADALRDFRASCRLHQPAGCHYSKILETEIVRGDRWVFFWYSRDNRQYFYDRAHLKTQSGSVKVVRVRIEADDSGGRNLVDRDKMSTGKDWGGHTLEWWEFDCPRSEFRISKRKRFDGNGQVIASYPDFEMVYRPVFPGGISEKLLGIVCSKGEKRGTTKKWVQVRQGVPIFSP